LEAIYSLSPDLKLDVRPCEDGVLVYDSMARTTHLIPPVAWDFFVSLSQTSPAVVQSELSEVDAVDMLLNDSDSDRLAMLTALERAGLIMRC